MFYILKDAGYFDVFDPPNLLWQLKHSLGLLLSRGISNVIIVCACAKIVDRKIWRSFVDQVYLQTLQVLSHWTTSSWTVPPVNCSVSFAPDPIRAKEGCLSTSRYITQKREKMAMSNAVNAKQGNLTLYDYNCDSKCLS